MHATSLGSCDLCEIVSLEAEAADVQIHAVQKADDGSDGNASSDETLSRYLVVHSRYGADRSLSTFELTSQIPLFFLVSLE